MEVTLKLSVQEVNLVLSALGMKPFAEVSQLVNNIMEQGQKQIQLGENKEVKKEKPLDTKKK